MEKSDETLLRKYAENQSEEAFRTLAKRHGPMVYGACLRYLQNAELAEDAAQAVFLLLAEKAPQIRVPTTLIPWCLAASKNISRRLARSEARRKRHEQAVPVEIATKSPAEDAALFAALDGLRSEEREAVVLRFVQGLSLAEVGQSLGVSEDAARMRVQRGLTRLRQKFVGSVTVSSSLLDRLANPLNVSPAIRALALPKPLLVAAVPGALVACGTLAVVAAGATVLPKRLSRPSSLSAPIARPAIKAVKVVRQSESQPSGPSVGVLDKPFTLEYRFTITYLTPQKALDKNLAEQKKRIDADLDADHISPEEHDRQVAWAVHQSQVRHREGRITLSYDGQTFIALQTEISPDPDKKELFFRPGQTFQIFDGANTVCYWNPGIRQEFMLAVPLVGPSLPYLTTLRGQKLLAMDIAPSPPDAEGNDLAYVPGKIVLNKNGSVAQLNFGPDKKGRYWMQYQLSDHVSLQGRWVAKKISYARFNGGVPTDRTDYTLVSARPEPLPHPQMLPDAYLAEGQPIQLNLPAGKYKQLHYSGMKGAADEQIAATLQKP